MKNTASSRWRVVRRAVGFAGWVLLAASSLMAQGAVVPFTGSLRLVETDLVLPAGAAPLALTRAVSVNAVDPGLLGTRWRLDWEMAMLRTPGAVIILEMEGPVLLEPSIDGDGYRNARGDRLEFAADGSAVLSRRSGVHEAFDSTGRLVSRSFRNGNEHRLDYGGDGSRRRVEGPKGSFFDLETAGGRLRAVNASNGDRVEYSYESGELAEVRVNGELVARYGYLPTGPLAELTDPATGTTTVAYDSEGRVIGRRFADGGVEGHEYDDEDLTYRITDGGGGITTMTRGADGDSLQVVDALGNITVTRFHESGQPLTVRHPDGSESRFTYDGLGRMTSSVNSGGRTEYGYLGETDLMTSVTYPDGMVETFEYDERGNLERLARGGKALLEIEWREDGLPSNIVVSDAPERSFGYLPNGLLETEAVAGEGEYRYEYDDRDYLRKLTDSVGGAITWTYDRGGRVITETDAAGGTVRLAYDERGLLATETDPAGGQWRYRYDSLGRLAAQVDPEGRTTEYVYDAAGRNTEVRLPGGAVWRYDYDAVGNVVHATNPVGGVIATSYDSMGRVASITDEAGQVWTCVYGPSGGLDAVRGPGGESLRLQRDAMGRVSMGSASSGRVQAFERDQQGRIRVVSTPGGLVERLSYDDEGRVASTSDNRGTRRRYTYDSLGRLAGVSTAAGLETSLSYDAVGRITKTENSLGETSAFSYDPRGLVESVRHGSGLTRYTYDAAGRLTAVTGALGGTRSLEYNRAGDLMRVTEASGDTTVFGYGGDGGLERMTLPGGGVVELGYDSMGNLVAERDPVGGQRRNSYDSAGRLIRQTDAMGRVTKLEYDGAGRLSRRVLPGGSPIDYSYDENGNLIRVDDGVFPVGYGYDAQGRRDRIEYPAIDRVIRMQYSDGGMLSSVSDPDRGVVVYDYDEAGRLASIRMDGHQPLTFSFDAGDRLTGIGYPNGVSGSTEYGRDGNVEAIRYLSPSGAVLAGWEYRYDAAGNPLTETAANGAAVHYRYDAAGRLIAESGGRGELRYSYAAGGNRAARAGAQGRTDYSYDAANRLISAADAVFMYDPNGNLVERRGPSGTTRYQWDAQDQLVAVTLPDGEAVRFGYAPTGERVWREDSEGRVYFVSDGTHVLAELDHDLELKAAYLHGPGIDQPLVMIRDGEPRYLHARLLGNVAAVSDADGREAARFEIDAFGRVISSTEDLEIPFLFTGREFDPDLGIYYYRARYYDPDTGRFLSEDPDWGELDDTVQHNRYLYARNTPTRFRDPMGLDPDLFDDLNQSISALVQKVHGAAKKGASSVAQFLGMGQDRFLHMNGLDAQQYSQLRNLQLENMRLQHQLIFKQPPSKPFTSGVDSGLRNIVDRARLDNNVKGAELVANVKQRFVQHNRQLNQMIATEAQRNLPVPASQNSPVPVQPRAALRPSGPASSGLTGATPKPLALPGNGPNTPLLPPGRGTGYKMLTSGKASIGTIPPSRGAMLAREGLRIGGGVASVALVGASSYLQGNHIANRYKNWGRQYGRNPGLGSPEHLVASTEATVRSALAVLTYGASETLIALAQLNLEIHRHAMARHREEGAQEQFRDKQKELETDKYMIGMEKQAQAFVAKASELRRQQLDLIAKAKIGMEAAQQNLPNLADVTASGTPVQDCLDCQNLSHRLRGSLGSLEEGLNSVKEDVSFAISSAQVACTRKNPDAADFEAARSSEAARAAQAATVKVQGLIETIATQKQEFAACRAKVEGLRRLLASIPTIEGQIADAKWFADAARQTATSAKRIHGQCGPMEAHCRRLTNVTAGAKHAGAAVVARHCNDLTNACSEIAADGTRGEGYVGLAEVDIANVEAALVQLKAMASRIGDCHIDEVAVASKAQLFNSAKQQVSGQLTRANTAAKRALECARLIKAGQPPPGPGGIGGDSEGTGEASGGGGTPPVIGASGGGDDTTDQGDAPPVVEASGGGGTSDSTTGDKPPVVEASTGGADRQPTHGQEEVTGILAPIGREDGKITKDEYGETQVTIRGADGRERLYSGEVAADKLVDMGYLTKRGNEYFPTSKFNSFGGPGTGTGGEEETGSGTTDLPVKKTRTADAAGGAPTGGTPPGGGQPTKAGAGTGGEKPPTGGGSGTGTGGGSTGAVTPNTEGGLFGVTTVGKGLDCSLDVTAKETECNKRECGYASRSEIPDDVTGEERKRKEACIENCRKRYEAEKAACYQ